MNEPIVCCCIHDEAHYLAESIASYAPAGVVFAYAGRVPGRTRREDWKAAAAVARAAGAEVALGKWQFEKEQRTAAVSHEFVLGCMPGLVLKGGRDHRASHVTKVA